MEGAAAVPARGDVDNRRSRDGGDIKGGKQDVATLRYNVVRVNKNTPGARVEPQPKLSRGPFKSLDFFLLRRVIVFYNGKELYHWTTAFNCYRSCYEPKICNVRIFLTPKNQWLSHKTPGLTETPVTITVSIISIYNINGPDIPNDTDFVFCEKNQMF